jgi:hypothetical protein
MSNPRDMPPPSEDPAHTHLRCACGSLIARFVAGQIELKCRRCKRTLLVPLERSAERDRP